MAEHLPLLTRWEKGLLDTVCTTLKRGRDLTMQQSLLLSKAFDRVQEIVG